MESRKRSGFTLDLGADLEAKLTAFCATYYTKTKHDVIREAVVAHMEAVFRADPERWRDYQRIMAGGTPRRRSPRGRTSRTAGL